ncbi:MAG: replicative DNA helicase [Myxococcales bacterium]|jgi:replicative DNA helicase|nr:replicative DNA helicase [Myxococcales bacterium]
MTAALLISEERIPRDLPAERAVLGGVLSDNRVLVDIATLLTPEDFHSDAHTAIFEAILALDHTHQAIDTLTVASRLKSSGKLSLAGGPAYLADLETSVPTTANIQSYARLVKEKSIKRRMLAACTDLSNLAVEASTEVEALLDEAQRRMFAIAEQRQEGDLRSIDKIMAETIDIIQTMQQSGGGITGLATGFIDLDKMLTGLHGGELIILAARPGCGKTSLALNICANAALRERQAVAIFSLEMPADQLGMRLLSAEARVSLKALRSGFLNRENQHKIEQACFQVGDAPIHIDDSGSLSAFDLRTKVRRLQAKLSKMDPPQSLGLVMIDYLQLMHQRGRVESRQQEVQEISRTLKALAKELSVPILALSQLNRKVEERRGTKSRPMLSDLRESGSIEQDADVVLFIHRDFDAADAEGGHAPPGAGAEVELVIAKQRNGPTGEIPLLLFSEFTRFENPARGE